MRPHYHGPRVSVSLPPTTLSQPPAPISCPHLVLCFPSADSPDVKKASQPSLLDVTLTKHL